MAVLYLLQTGLSGALETLCGQAYGARLYRMLGLYLQSSLIMSAAVSVLVSALWCFTEPVLVFLRQDPEVSSAAASFVRFQIPGLFAFSFLQCLLRYLQAQSVVAPLVACSVAPFALHVALAYLLVAVLGLGIAGVLLAARKLKRPARPDHGAFIARLELLPPPQPPPPQAPHPLTGLCFAIADA